MMEGAISQGGARKLMQTQERDDLERLTSSQKGFLGG